MAARQDQTSGKLTLVKMDCLGDVWGFAVLVGLASDTLIRSGLIPRGRTAGKREGAARLHTINRPFHILPAVHLAGITFVSEACLATNGNGSDDISCLAVTSSVPSSSMCLCHKLSRLPPVSVPENSRGRVRQKCQRVMHK